MPTKTIIIRVPPDLHQAARVKSINVGRSLNEVLSEKLAEWVRETDKAATAKSAKAASK